MSIELDHFSEHKDQCLDDSSLVTQINLFKIRCVRESWQVDVTAL